MRVLQMRSAIRAAVLVCMAVSAPGGPAFAVPVLPSDAGPLVQTRHVFDALGAAEIDNTVRTQTQIVGSFTASDGSVFSSRADLAGGEVGAFAAVAAPPPGSTPGFQRSSIASGTAWDILTFDLGGRSEAAIDFTWTAEGALSNSDPSSSVISAANGFRLFDVSGSDPVFDLGSDPADPFITADFDSVLVNEVLGFSIGAPPFFSPPGVVDSSGAPIEFQSGVSGSFTVRPDRVYAAQLFSEVQLDTGGPAEADFLGTAALRLTNLNGAVVNSASGAFLSNVGVTAVPEPASALLLAMGLIALATLRNLSKVPPPGRSRLISC